MKLIEKSKIDYHWRLDINFQHRPKDRVSVICEDIVAFVPGWPTRLVLKSWIARPYEFLDRSKLLLFGIRLLHRFWQFGLITARGAQTILDFPYEWLWDVESAVHFWFQPDVKLLRAFFWISKVEFRWARTNMRLLEFNTESIPTADHALNGLTLSIVRILKSTACLLSFISIWCKLSVSLRLSQVLGFVRQIRRLSSMHEFSNSGNEWGSYRRHRILAQTVRINSARLEDWSPRALNLSDIIAFPRSRRSRQLGSRTEAIPISERRETKIVQYHTTYVQIGEEIDIFYRSESTIFIDQENSIVTSVGSEYGIRPTIVAC